MTSMPQPTAAIKTLPMADGLIVHLSGALTAADLPQIRRALLMPMPTCCRDIIIDAGEVSTADDYAVAALVAARDWARASGRRFSASRVSDSLWDVMDELDLPDVLAPLGPPRRPIASMIPAQRKPSS